MSTVRWKFFDTETNESITLPLNPNKADATTAAREFAFGYSPDGVLRGFDPGPDKPMSWTFSGVILEKAHYDLLLAWAKRSSVLVITDHVGRVVEVLIEKFDPIERPASRRYPWKADYTMTCLLLKEPL